ncbi:hypothetical protein MTR_4g036480 [Medicago truncatula]|uniref:Uncharacterized protein n=1 Tax=Medicago truncatula TaxID=3880 RepID=G7JSE6_MEDTR|nr:hypothetical protein MTR_4g036480 [Medicago truncatula]
MTPKRKGKEIESSGSGAGRNKATVKNHGINFKDDKQRSMYKSLISRLISACRYPDVNAMDRLGIEDHVIRLLNNLGLVERLKPMRGFENFTYEFLSLANAGYIHDSWDQSLKPAYYDPVAFWKSITGLNQYNSRSNKGRKEVGMMRTDELFMLWAMLYNRPVNTCYYLLDYLVYVANKKLDDKSDIVVGGIITFIARKIGSERPRRHSEGKATHDLDDAKSTGGKQGMADALTEMTKRSSYFQQIEEDVQKYTKHIIELRSSITNFKTKEMTELIKFHKDVESVLSRFEGFPSKKLEAIRMAAALFNKLDSILNELQNVNIVTPVTQVLDKIERYFNKERRINNNSDGKRKECGGKLLWRAFQFAFRVYTFAGGHDDRADKLIRELAKEIESDPNQPWLCFDLFYNDLDNISI